jgi:tetratricopeptide (TPR) repeat protein
MILFASFLHAVVETNYHIIGFLLLNAAALSVVSGRLWKPVWETTIRVGGGVRWASLALLAAMAAYSGMTLGGTLLEARGNAALRAGQFEGAALRFSRAAAVDPWRASSPDSAAAALYRLYESGGGGDSLSRAVESEMEATIRNRLDFRFHARLGFLYAEALDRFPESGRGTILGASLAAYEKAVMLNPHSAEIRYRKALMLRTAGRAEESRRLIEVVLSEEPRYARGWVFLGEVLERDDRKKAVAAYEKAIELYYTYAKMAADPAEREFLALDFKAVEKRVRELKADRGR